MTLTIFFDHLREAVGQTGKSLEDICRIAVNCGISGLECSLESLTEAPKERLKLFNETGLKVSSIYATFDFANVIDEARIKLLIDTAVLFEAKHVLVIPGFRPFTCTPYEATRQVGTDEMERMASGIEKLIAYADTKGVQVNMEDYDDAPAPFASEVQLEWFADRVHGLHICFDTGNFMYADVDELVAFEVLKDNIGYVHLKDRAFTGGDKEWPKATVSGVNMYASVTGAGVIHMKEILVELKKQGYDGPMAIEHFGAPDQIEFMKASAKWVLETWNDQSNCME